ncbi:hypothetical protein [uncultured Alteromonas sp.]|uniref:hypothetical protein n=1 Tax=uncultured Alteromonas sp. TaxID=179113 RepID=UPI0030DD07A2
MARKSATKNIYYLRASNEKQPFDIEELLKTIRRDRPTVGDTEVELGSGDILRIQHYRDEGKDKGCSIHIVAYTPGEKASTLLPKISSHEDYEDVYPAPEGKEYKDGECFLLLKNHHVMFCGHGISVSKATLYLSLLAKRGIEKHSQPVFDISPVSNIDKIKLLQEQGVKSISLSTNAYDLSIPEKKTQNRFKRILAAAANEVKALVEKDESLSEQKAREDLLVGLELKLDGNTRACEETQEYITDIAKEYIGDSDDGWHHFEIITRTGERIKPGNIRLQKTVRLEKTEKNISCYSAWEALTAYLVDIENGRLSEQ